MKTRLLKEARQLLPAWVAALLLASVPVLLAPAGEEKGWTATALGLGLAILSVAGFGREFSQRTFALFVVQPVSRERLWWEKVSVQALSTVTVVGAFVLSWMTILPMDVFLKSPSTPFAVSAALAALGGGLCLALLLRQILAAMFLTILLPVGLLLPVALLPEKWFPENWLQSGGQRFLEVLLPSMVLSLYGLLTFCLARLLFLRAQDAQWTGGDVTLPSVSRWLPRVRTATRFRTAHPLLALFWKELQFQQVSFLLAGLLLVVQIAGLVLSKLGVGSENATVKMILDGLWYLWVVLPLLVGCNAVAEERKLGTLEPQLCLPVSRGRQFAVKTFVTLTCGLTLGTLLPLPVMLVARHLRLPSADPFAAWPSQDALGWLSLCAGITLVALYASTLTRHLLQAFGAAIAMIALVPLLGGLSSSITSGRFGYGPIWMMSCFPLFFALGPLVLLIFVMAATWSRLRRHWTGLIAGTLLVAWVGKVEWHPVNFSRSDLEGFWVFGFRMPSILVSVLCMTPLALLLVVLAYLNFRHTQTSGRLWRRNVETWATCFLVTVIVSALVYNRIWELTMPFEPPAGPARLSGSVKPVIALTTPGAPTFVLLPDGRLCFFTEYKRVPLPIPQMNTNRSREREFTWREEKNPRVEFLGGSNWVSIAATYHELFGVKSDGSMWNAYWSEWVAPDGSAGPIRSFATRPERVKSRLTRVKLERIGDNFDWVTVASSRSHFAALKRDGTIWGWGNNDRKQLGEGPAAITHAPVQISKEADWVAIYAGYEATTAVKRDGSIWKWGLVTKTFYPRTIRENGPTKLNITVPGVRRVASYSEWDLILDKEGNLWGLGGIPSRLLDSKGFGFYEVHTNPKKLDGANWADVCRAEWEGLVGVKQDGSLWDESRRDDYRRLRPLSVRLGNRTDWLAEAYEWPAVIALAKDGTVCRFGKSFYSDDLENLLAPTRRCTWSVNLLDSAN